MPSIYRPGLFDGHVAIVTGGGSGIGLSIAKALVELGAKVAIGGRNQEKLAAAKAELEAYPSAEGRVLTGPLDIREHESIAAFLDGVETAFGPTTVLVNNAGGQFPTPAEALAPKGWDAVVRNNLSGTFYVTQAVANRHMIPKRRGRVVNIIANVFRGFPGMVHTGAARAGVENMTKTLAVEWAQHNVQINAIAPGTIRSTGTDRYPPELVEMSRQKTPAKRLGTPEEVAQLAVYLACDAADYVTGECWYIDGGQKLWGDVWMIPDAPERELPPAVKRLGEK